MVPMLDSPVSCLTVCVLRGICRPRTQAGSDRSARATRSRARTHTPWRTPRDRRERTQKVRRQLQQTFDVAAVYPGSVLTRPSVNDATDGVMEPPVSRNTRPGTPLVASRRSYSSSPQSSSAGAGERRQATPNPSGTRHTRRRWADAVADMNLTSPAVAAPERGQAIEEWHRRGRRGHGADDAELDRLSSCVVEEVAAEL